MAGYTNKGTKDLPAVARLGGKVPVGEERFTVDGVYIPKSLLTSSYPGLELTTESASPWNTIEIMVFPHKLDDICQYSHIGIFNNTDGVLFVLPNNHTADNARLPIPAGAYYPIGNSADINTLEFKTDGTGSVFVTLTV